MAHGNYYGIQYEIYLTKELDFYDELLPIWMEVRAKIEMEKDKKTDNYKLIIIPYKEIGQQLYRNSLFNSYVRENEDYSNTKATKDEKYLRTKKFVMVKQYEYFIRHKTSLPEPITREEFNKLSIEKQKLEEESLWCRDLSQEEWREHDRKYNKVFNQLLVQRIIHDSEYFNEIKSLHTQLLKQVSFDNKQRERIQKVISHPKLEGIITWYGLSLVNL